jgi:general secretion pathway protein C
VFANGAQRGYRVYPGRNRAQFSKLGLVPGDLVLSINGTPLDDPQRGMEIFNTIGSAGQVNVTVERNGQTQDLTLNMAQINVPDGNGGQPPRPAQRPNTPQPPAE